jgi:hypothetical protein
VIRGSSWRSDPNRVARIDQQLDLAVLRARPVREVGGGGDLAADLDHPKILAAQAAVCSLSCAGLPPSYRAAVAARGATPNTPLRGGLIAGPGTSMTGFQLRLVDQPALIRRTNRELPDQRTHLPAIVDSWRTSAGALRRRRAHTLGRWIRGAQPRMLRFGRLGFVHRAGRASSVIVAVERVIAIVRFVDLRAVVHFVRREFCQRSWAGVAWESRRMNLKNTKNTRQIGWPLVEIRLFGVLRVLFFVSFV